MVGQTMLKWHAAVVTLMILGGGGAHYAYHRRRGWKGKRCDRSMRTHPLNLYRPLVGQMLRKHQATSAPSVGTA